MPPSGSRNTAYLLIEKVISLGSIALVNIIVLRSLGPAVYGNLGAATAILAMCLPLTLFGNVTIVRLLAHKPEFERALLRRATLLSALGAGTGVAVMLGLGLSGALGVETSGLLLILAVALLARPLSVVDLWFQAKRFNPIAARTRTVVTLLAGISRALAAILTESLVVIAIVIVLENVAGGLALLAMYLAKRRRLLPIEQAQGDRRMSREILTTSIPYLVYAMTVILFMRVDQPMLLILSDPEEVGLYAAAANISDGASFIPTSLLTAALPILTTLYVSNRVAYAQKLGNLLHAGAAMGYIVAALGIALAPLMIPFLYGPEYQSSALLLQILLLGVPFLFVGHLRTAAIVAENLERETMWIGALALGLNVGLNFVLIPHLGAIGAAASTSVAHAVNGVFGNIIFRRTRPLLRRQLRAMEPVSAFRTLVSLVRRRSI